MFKVYTYFGLDKNLVIRAHHWTNNERIAGEIITLVINDLTDLIRPKICR